MTLTEMDKEVIYKVFHRYYNLTDRTMDLVFKIVSKKKYNKNSYIIQIGDIANELYILLKGAVVSYYINYEGNTYNKNIFLEGNFVGSTVSYLTQSPSKFVLEAIEETELFCFDYQKFRALINSDTDMKDFYISYLENNWIIEKEKREVSIVLEDAETRYLSLINSSPGIENRIPLRYIASNLGITPTQLSRIRKKLKK